jgi:hypothetical protein
MSTPTLGAYEALMNQRYHDFLINSLKLWGSKNKVQTNHSFWRRLSGGEYYCRGLFRPDEQVVLTSKGQARYSQVNYCYGLHRTVEVRVLPMFKQKNLAISAIYHILRMTQRYLSLPNTFKNDLPVFEINVEAEPVEFALNSQAGL